MRSSWPSPRTPAVVSGAGLDLVVHARERFDCVDLTEHVVSRMVAAGLSEGLCVMFTRHTTCALTINEWEDGALEDFRRRVQDLFPPDDYYAHDDLDRRTQNLVPGERRNGHAHVAQMLMGGSSLSIPVRDGDLMLGTWQRIILVELDHPKRRDVALQLLGERTTDARPRQPAGISRLTA